MKKVVITFILIAVLYFLAGWTLVVWGPLSTNAYVISASIVGSLASCLGLLSLVRPGLTRQDLKTVEMETLKQIGQLGQELEAMAEQKKELTTAKNSTESELEKLQRQKNEMELLVKKASLVLFTEEQLKRYQADIEEMLEQNVEIKRLVDGFTATKKKLAALRHEVEKGEDAELLSWILESARERKMSSQQSAQYKAFPYGFIFEVAKALFR